MPTDIQVLAAIRDRLAAEELAGNADYLGSLLADDIVILPPGMPPLEGTESCREFIRDVLRHYERKHVSYGSDKVSVEGDVAFEHGRYTIETTVRGSGRGWERETGKYLWIFRRGVDGAWRMVRIVWNMDEIGDEASTGDDARARQLVEALGLEPHPEGGHYRQIHRSASYVHPDDDRPLRSSLTTIYFLLARGQHSRWHRVRSDEVWHFYEGDPLELLVGDPAMTRIDRVTLGSLSGEARPVHVVPAGWWQAARPLGRYSLVGCTVAPGFEFEDFEFLRDAPTALEGLRSLHTPIIDLV